MAFITCLLRIMYWFAMCFYMIWNKLAVSYFYILRFQSFSIISNSKQYVYVHFHPIKVSVVSHNYLFWWHVNSIRLDFFFLLYSSSTLQKSILEWPLVWVLWSYILFLVFIAILSSMVKLIRFLSFFCVAFKSSIKHIWRCYSLLYL